MLNITNTNTKNVVELKKELNANGISIEYITIEGKKIGMLGAVSEADKEAAIKTLNAAYAASNGNIYEMMQKLTTLATIEENEIDPDEVVQVRGVDTLLSYSKKTIYTMTGKEIANCTELPSMPNEAIKAVLIARAETALS